MKFSYLGARIWISLVRAGRLKTAKIASYFKARVVQFGETEDWIKMVAGMHKC